MRHGAVADDGEARAAAAARDAPVGEAPPGGARHDQQRHPGGLAQPEHLDAQEAEEGQDDELEDDARGQGPAVRELPSDARDVDRRRHAEDEEEEEDVARELQGGRHDGVRARGRGGGGGGAAAGERNGRAGGGGGGSVGGGARGRRALESPPMPKERGVVWRVPAGS